MVVDPPTYTVITIVDGPSTAPHSPRSMAQIEDVVLREQQMKIEPANIPENRADNNIDAIIAPNNNTALMPHHEAVCHVCDNVILGIRYKCFECVDYVSIAL